MNLDANWITAGSTFASAVFAAIAAVIMSAGYRRETRAKNPQIETSYRWVDHQLSGAIRFDFEVNNPLAEALKVEAVKLLKPNSSMFAKLIAYSNGRPTLQPTTERSDDLNLYVPASNATSAPKCVGVLYFLVPEGWNGGKVTLEFTISSRADSFRHKKFKVVRQISPRKQDDAFAV